MLIELQFETIWLILDIRCISYLRSPCMMRENNWCKTMFFFQKLDHGRVSNLILIGFIILNVCTCLSSAFYQALLQ